jgi:hypothetical protein
MASAQSPMSRSISRFEDPGHGGIGEDIANDELGTLHDEARECRLDITEFMRDCGGHRM